MKKILILLLAVLMTLSFTACNNNATESREPYVQKEPALDETEYRLPENVEAWVIEGSTDDSHAVLNIVNTSKSPVSFPVEYRLEKLVDGKWYELFPITEIDWDTTIYTIEPNSAKKITIGFMLAYGELENGTYRILRQVHVPDDKNDYFIHCEFTLE